MPRFIYCYAECHYAECCHSVFHYAECRYALWRYSECHCASCHYAECRYAECCFVMLNVVVPLTKPIWATAKLEENFIQFIFVEFNFYCNKLECLSLKRMIFEANSAYWVNKLFDTRFLSWATCIYGSYYYMNTILGLMINICF